MLFKINKMVRKSIKRCRKSKHRRCHHHCSKSRRKSKSKPRRRSKSKRRQKVDDGGVTEFFEWLKRKTSPKSQSKNKSNALLSSLTVKNLNKRFSDNVDQHSPSIKITPEMATQQLLKNRIIDDLSLEEIDSIKEKPITYLINKYSNKDLIKKMFGSDDAKAFLFLKEAQKKKLIEIINFKTKMIDNSEYDANKLLDILITSQKPWLQEWLKNNRKTFVYEIQVEKDASEIKLLKRKFVDDKKHTVEETYDILLPEQKPWLQEWMKNNKKVFIDETQTSKNWDDIRLLKLKIINDVDNTVEDTFNILLSSEKPWLQQWMKENKEKLIKETQAVKVSRQSHRNK